MSQAALMDEAQARDEICRVGRSLFERGYVHATAGNISVRLANGFLITPTDACMGTLRPDRLALVDTAGQQVSGDTASKTLLLHRRIYDATESQGHGARCVIHTHSTHLVACSLLADSAGVTCATTVGHGVNALAAQPAPGELLPPITPYFVMKVGRVPHISYHRPGASEAAQEVVDAIVAYGQKGKPLRAVMLARLGPNVWHDSPAAAMAVLEELEETARLWLHTQGKISPLSDAHIDALRLQFKAVW